MMQRYSQLPDAQLLQRWHELHASKHQFTDWVVLIALEEMMRRRGIPIPEAKVINLAVERARRRST